MYVPRLAILDEGNLYRENNSSYNDELVLLLLLMINNTVHA